MRHHQWRLSRQPPNAAFDHMIAVESDCGFGYITGRTSYSQNGRGEGQSKRPRNGVISGNFRLVDEIFHQPTNGWQPEQRIRQAAQQKQSQRITTSRVCNLVSQYRLQLRFRKRL